MAIKKRKYKVVFGFLGSTMDAVSRRRGKYEKRWQRWRPTVSIAQHPEAFPVDRLVLLYNPQDRELADEVIADIGDVAPKLQVDLQQLDFDAPWDLHQVFPKLYQFIDGYPFDTEKEEYFFHITTGSHIQQISIFLSVGARYFPGKLLQTAPSRDHEGGSKVEVIDLDNAPRSVAEIFSQSRKRDTDYLKSGINTRNADFNQLIKQIETVAIRTRAPILITGPTGAGKSRLGSRIYELKRKRQDVKGAFVEVNCATLRGDNAMSALFGHRKGAFTGAVEKRDGLLKEADGGVLFLDEIGELPLDEQAMLLRAIEDKRFFPLGADKEENSDFQLIAGTNRDLRQDVIDGRFREDLFSRINLWTYRLPGLADRHEDIEPNLDYELQRFERENGIRVRFSQESRKRYLKFACSPSALWKGNFRDLNASVTRMATLAEAGEIDVALVEAEMERLGYLWGMELRSATQQAESGLLENLLSPEQMEEMDHLDQVQLEAVVRACRDSSSAAEAGRRLFAASRLKKRRLNDSQRVAAILDKYGLHFDQIKNAR
ncbi:RNA repair transcriptional activator RtcR [Hahella sp. NBU794]|uniref:RNA repair transcriptional activator RtcR n=1 Tax=Hahella sp. NBU794 TaxID=3422590 RepID=UPI003D6F7088